ncbi:MAG: T9SS type A sorting domain-containing protein, partial [Saprospiraceae bacterium]|nr:T9SS type A sorting domain-containing protein [Saprospiraceae bacterium]
VQAKEVSIFPNPSHTGLFNLEVEFPIESIRVLNIAGETLPEQKGQFGKNITINLADQPPGMYILEIIEKNNPPYMLKLLKQ